MIGLERVPTLSAPTSESIPVLQEVLSAHSRDLVQDHLRVAELARATAILLGLPDDAVLCIELAARLRDIGRIAIPDAILHKPAALTREEWALMRSHTEVGARIVGAAPALRGVAALVRAHHERYDGCGYPDGLRGERIPLGACILSVCDAFVAMMRASPYIDAITVVEAIAELRRCAGTRFHPAAVIAFEHAFRELFDGR